MVVTTGGKKLGETATAVKNPGTYAIQFANVDNRLTLWVDGEPIFGDGLAYEDDPEKIARRAMAVAAEVCVFTNDRVTLEVIEG